MEQICNVIFDLGGVLVGLDLERCHAAFERIGLPEIGALIDPCPPVARMQRMEAGEITFHEACEAMRRQTGNRTVSDDEIAGAMTAFLVDTPICKLRQIDALRRRGIRTYVLSNNNPAAMAAIARMFAADGKRMEDYFDRIFISYEMRMLKPSEEIFRAVLEQAGIRAAESLFIDDSERNVAAAARLGMATYRPVPDEDLGSLLERVGRPER